MPPHANPNTSAYWDNQQWDESLLKAVQSAVHDPVDTNDLSAPGIHGVVKFTVVNGTIEYPEIVQSTGDTRLDELMLQQVASVAVPKPIGAHPDEAHEFAMPLYMPTPLESFEHKIEAAIGEWRLYPKDALVRGAMGTAVVDFNYQDGKADDIAIETSSKDRDLDRASLRAVVKATMPPASPAYAGKLLHLEMSFCYSLENAWKCPTGLNVVDVRGTFLRRVSTSKY